MNEKLIKNPEQAIRDLETLTISSIEANARSLLGQLAEYSFLTISPEQFSELKNIEYKFHKLVKEITHDST
jgi:chlorite dismutase